MEGSGAAMKSSMIGARIPIVGSNIAARRRTACFLISSREQTLGEIGAALDCHCEQLVGARRAGLGSQERDAAEGIRLPPAGA
jgi:hypothetical protein